MGCSRGAKRLESVKQFTNAQAIRPAFQGERAWRCLALGLKWAKSAKRADPARHIVTMRGMFIVAAAFAVNELTTTGRWLIG